VLQGVQFWVPIGGQLATPINKYFIYDDLIQLTKGKESKYIENADLWERVDELEVIYNELIDDISHALNGF